nr:hypothetical protein Iba_chr04eCG18270 [Ipomoea batatas]
MRVELARDYDSMKSYAFVFLVLRFERARLGRRTSPPSHSLSFEATAAAKTSGEQRAALHRRSAMRDVKGDNELPSSPLPTLPSSFNGKATFGGEASSGGASAAAAVALGVLSRRSTRWQWHVLAKSRQPQQWKPRVSGIRLHQRRRVGIAAAGAPPGDKGVVFLLLLYFSLDVTKGRRRATAASGGS